MHHGIISSDFVIKSRKKKNKKIEGYASVFGVIDTHNDLILPEAFSDIDLKTISLEKIPLLWQHDHKKPIGIVESLSKDDYGLKMVAEINADTMAGVEAISLVEQKSIKGISIGFKIKKSDRNKDGVREIRALELLEVSIVTFPANYDAKISCIKNQNHSEKKESNVQDDIHQKVDRLAELVEKIKKYYY